jgi:hypothetical protein
VLRITRNQRTAAFGIIKHLETILVRSVNS